VRTIKLQAVYELVGKLGVGRSSTVHLARPARSDDTRWLAMKEIPGRLVEDRNFHQMFVDEAYVATRISDANLATVFELGRHEDTYWIVMEYVDGEPLREVYRLRGDARRPVPPEVACRMIADAALGLHAAHEVVGDRGERLHLVHNEVTPRNLFVTYDGHVKVAGFGLAKIRSRVSKYGQSRFTERLAYMSPEQVNGEDIDRRTDTFALGVVLWELTTGRRLFNADTDAATLKKVQECDVPPPSTLVPGYPPDLEAIIMTALAKRRAERFATAQEFSRALQSLLMRRGLFIVTEDVANHVGPLLSESRRKREELLRRASSRLA
jgi:serine/threonine-protein kinase